MTPSARSIRPRNSLDRGACRQGHGAAARPFIGDRQKVPATGGSTIPELFCAMTAGSSPTQERPPPARGPSARNRPTVGRVLDGRGRIGHGSPMAGPILGRRSRTVRRSRQSAGALTGHGSLWADSPFKRNWLFATPFKGVSSSDLVKVDQQTRTWLLFSKKLPDLRRRRKSANACFHEEQ